MQAQDQNAVASDTTPQADRVPTNQKIAYGIGSVPDLWGTWLYPGLVWQVFNIHLLVSPSLISTALMITRVFDGVTDPLFGWLSDNTRTRWGRRRPYILIFSIICGLTFPLLFFVTPGWGSTHISLPIHFSVWRIVVDLRDVTISNYFWFMLGSFGLYISLLSGYTTPFNALGAELTPDYHERTRLMAVRQALQRPFEIAMFSAAAFTTLSWFNDANGKPNILLGAQVYCAILGVGMIIAGIITFAVVRERYYDTVVAHKKDKVSILDAFGRTLKCRPFRSQLTMILAYGMGTIMVGSLGYYNTVYYVCGGDVARGNRWNFLMGWSNMGLALVGIGFFTWIARRFGKRHAMRCMQIAALLVFVGAWWLYDPDLPWLQPFASGLIAFTGVGFWMLSSSMVADVIDYDELETGQRREGAFKACESWFMKLGMALGVGMSGYILDATGFDAKLEGNQSPQAIFWIRFTFSAIPVAGLLLAMFALSRYRLTQERMAEIRAQLEARRGKV
jgi:glycoside/pentoside/hexuronide:cation symporter, GPH family